MWKTVVIDEIGPANRARVTADIEFASEAVYSLDGELLTNFVDIVSIKVKSVLFATYELTSDCPHPSAFRAACDTAERQIRRMNANELLASG